MFECGKTIVWMLVLFSWFLNFCVLNSWLLNFYLVIFLIFFENVYNFTTVMISLCTGFMCFFFPLIHWDISRMNYGIYLIDNQFSIKIGQMYGSKTLLNGVFFFLRKKLYFVYYWVGVMYMQDWLYDTTRVIDVNG